jgi:hypothetical protein
VIVFIVDLIAASLEGRERESHYFEMPILLYICRADVLFLVVTTFKCKFIKKTTFVTAPNKL